MQRKGRKVRSMRGEQVDFDLMDIKRQMQEQPKSVEVKAREDFIEQRLKRRAKRRVQSIQDKEAEAKQKAEEQPEAQNALKGYGALPPDPDVIGKTAASISPEPVMPENEVVKEHETTKKRTRRIKKKTEE